MCENAVKKTFGGDGMAWRREQADILAHAKKLGYDRDGGSIIGQTDNKADWESWKSGFLNWRQKNVALEKEGKAFWQRGSGSGGGSSQPAPASGPIDVGPSPMQERAARNQYFPMLVPEYTAPQALDYSAYMPENSPFGGMNGLLYQPGTQQYREAFPIADNILSYQPPELGFPQVTYSNPIALNFAPVETGGGGGGGNKKKKEEDDDEPVDSDKHLPHGSQGGAPDAPGDKGDRPGHDPSMGGAATGGKPSGIPT